MTTKLISLNNDTTMQNDKVYQFALQHAQNECLDMQDEFSNEQIAEMTQQLVAKLYRVKTPMPVTVTLEYGKYTIKARSARQGSFISVSDSDTTGVARSLAQITLATRPITEDEVKDIISMINEAWYHIGH